MKRRSFVRGLLGLTGLAASGVSIAIEPNKPLIRNLVAGKGISRNPSPDIFIEPEYTEAKWDFPEDYRKGSDIDKAIKAQAKRMADELEADFAKFMLRNSHLSG